MKGPRNRLGSLVRLGVSLLLLGWVIGTAEWSSVLDHLPDADWRFLTAFILMTPINATLSTWKWRALLSARGFSLPFGALFKMFLAGQFFSNVLPSSVGGDVMRAVLLNRVMHDPKQAASSIVMERLTGLLVLIVIGPVAALSVPGLRSNPALMVLVVASLLGSFALFASILSTRLLALFNHLFGRWRLPARVLGKAESFQRALHDYRDAPRVLLLCLFLSFLFYTSAVLTVWVVCAGIGQPVPVLTTAIVVPVVLLVSMLPITVAGLGLSEWTYMVGFQALGAPGALGAAAGLVMRLRSVIWSSAGYLVYLSSEEAKTPLQKTARPGDGALPREASRS